VIRQPLPTRAERDLRAAADGDDGGAVELFHRAIVARIAGGPRRPDWLRTATGGAAGSRRGRGYPSRPAARPRCGSGP
jgi:hypothetical protein